MLWEVPADGPVSPHHAHGLCLMAGHCHACKQQCSRFLIGQCAVPALRSGHGAMRENHFLDDGTYSASQIIIIMVQRFLEDGPKGKDIYGSLLGGLKEPVESNEFRLKLKARKLPHGDARMYPFPWSDWQPRAGMHRHYACRRAHS